MGNKHGKWFPEVALSGWARHGEGKYTPLLAHRSRRRSRKASRKYVFLEIIEEEQLVPDDHAGAQNRQELLLLPQDTETCPVAQMPPETVRSPDVAWPTALRDPKAKDAQVKMDRIQEAKSDGQEQPHPVTSALAEDPVLPNGSAPGKRKGLMEEKVPCCFSNRTERGKSKEAKIGEVSVWDVDELTPEDEAIIELEEHLFEYKERATKKGIRDPAEHGIDGLRCEDEALQSRDTKETDCPPETNVEYPLRPVPQESLQSEMTAAEVKERQ